jgi:hypothetical protein
MPARGCYLQRTRILFQFPLRTPCADSGRTPRTSLRRHPCRGKSLRPAFQVGPHPECSRFSEGSLLRSLFFCNIAEERHPIPVICIGQASCLPSAGWMRRVANIATNFFQRARGPQKQFGQPDSDRVFHSLFPTSHLRFFPLRFYVGKIGCWRRSVSYQSTV